MLTDVFFRRYEKRLLFPKVGQPELKFFVQAYKMINTQLFSPYYNSEKKVDKAVEKLWTDLHDKLSLEIGVKELATRYYSYQTEMYGKPYTNSGYHAMNYVCEQFLTQGYKDDWDADVFVKIRLSFVELAYRERGAQVAQINANLPGALQYAATVDAQRKAKGFAPTVTSLEAAKKNNADMNATFAANVHELNERFKQAGMPLNYHNGFIQITQDALVQAQIEQPFWDLVKDPKWKNVSTDMATAFDLRDTAGPDPSFYAGRALESTIKIISDEKNWSTGNEKGVGGYLNNLTSKANGSFIAPWEHESMQRFFSDVRNDLAHGPGSKEMPKLSVQQIDHTIEFCMSWVKSLVARL